MNSKIAKGRKQIEANLMSNRKPNKKALYTSEEEALLKSVKKLKKSTLKVKIYKSKKNVFKERNLI